MLPHGTSLLDLKAALPRRRSARRRTGCASMSEQRLEHLMRFYSTLHTEFMAG